MYTLPKTVRQQYAYYPQQQTTQYYNSKAEIVHYQNEHTHKGKLQQQQHINYRHYRAVLWTHKTTQTTDSWSEMMTTVEHCTFSCLVQVYYNTGLLLHRHYRFVLWTHKTVQTTHSWYVMMTTVEHCTFSCLVQVNYYTGTTGLCYERIKQHKPHTLYL